MKLEEFLQKRIENKKMEIGRFERKKALIMRAKDTNWRNNPYSYSENDLRSANGYIELAKRALAGYERELADLNSGKANNVTYGMRAI